VLKANQPGPEQHPLNIQGKDYFAQNNRSREAALRYATAVGSVAIGLGLRFALAPLLGPMFLTSRFFRR
jgi:hypothetical protein